MSRDYPFNVEYAKSGRSACKGCHSPIGKDELRMGIMIQSPHFDGRIPNWFHYTCFWRQSKARQLKSEADIHHFDNLRWDDQERIRKQIGSDGGDASSGAAKSTEPPDDVKISDFEVEVAKSGRSKCRECNNNVLKDEIRVGRHESSKRGVLWYHLACFAGKREEYGFMFDPEKIPGFHTLDANDKALVNEKLKKTSKRNLDEENGGSATATAPKKLKAGNGSANNEDDEKLALKQQNDDLWKLRDQLKSLKKTQMTALLTHNNQDIPVGEAKIMDRLTDIMLFGTLARCEECGGGQLVFSSTNNTYCCTGSVSGFTGCQFKTNIPKRLPFEIPEEGFEEVEFIESFVFKAGRLRVFPPTRSSLSGNESFTASIGSGSSTLSKNKSMKSSDSQFKSSRTSQKMVVKGGVAVDPDFEYAAVVHVYQDKGKNVFNAVLGRADVQMGSNSFYKLQLLEHDQKKKYWLYRAWGRVGTTVGGTKADDFGPDLEGAMDEFRRLYLDKTGNEWDERHSFVKKHRLMYPMDIDYGEEDESELKSKVKAGSKSTLDKPIQDLIKMIFDIEQMKETMKEFEIDLQKMPLGKLSKKQIQEAYSVLTELQGELQGGQNATKILDCSNRFFTLIPHDFGMNKPPLLDNAAIVKAKTEMLDNLLEIEVAYAILKGDTGDNDPIDVHYEKLKTDLEVVNKASKEFKMIDEYVKNTHAATHSQYKLVVDEVFKTNRHGEFDRYTPFKDLHNRMLLWHGSRTSNYAGILSQGLRIAPPEAPVTGYMFGKGVYFADMVSKSANYCYTNQMNPIGLVLLCEVALGEMQEYKNAHNVTKLPAGKHSVKGIGKTAPDPSGAKTLENGTVVPMGKGADLGIGASSLLYNEYIVYDVAQVSMKYLIKMRFEYKY